MPHRTTGGGEAAQQASMLQQPMPGSASPHLTEDSHSSKKRAKTCGGRECTHAKGETYEGAGNWGRTNTLGGESAHVEKLPPQSLHKNVIMATALACQLPVPT